MSIVFSYGLRLRDTAPASLPTTAVVFTGQFDRIEEGIALLEAGRIERLFISGVRRETELRDRYGSAAQGFAADTGDQIAVFIEAPDAAETAAVASLFPSFASWYRNQVRAGWELQSDGYTSALVNYGTVRWQGRALDTVFVKIAVGMQHRELGKYEETCLLMGAVIDQEFSRYRDVFEAPCLEAEPARVGIARGGPRKCEVSSSRCRAEVAHGGKLLAS